MSLAKRLMRLARANANDFASAFKRDDDYGLTDEERRQLEAELAAEDEHDETVGGKAGRQARRVRDAAEEAWDRAFEKAQARSGGRIPNRQPSPAKVRERWYKTLEVPVGSDLDTVRRAYRKMVAKYHPDRYASEPEKYKAATEVARKITEAYEGLKAELE